MSPARKLSQTNLLPARPTLRRASMMCDPALFENRVGLTPTPPPHLKLHGCAQRFLKPWWLVLKGLNHVMQAVNRSIYKDVYICVYNIIYICMCVHVYLSVCVCIHICICIYLYNQEH